MHVNTSLIFTGVLIKHGEYAIKVKSMEGEIQEMSGNTIKEYRSFKTA
jgi:hypothetical protein